MIVGEADGSSLKLNEMFRLQPPLAGILGIVTLNLLPSHRIANLIGPAASLTFVALACIGLIATAALPLIFCQQRYSSTLLLKQGTI